MNNFGHAVFSPGGLGLDFEYGYDEFLLSRIGNEKIKERLWQRPRNKKLPCGGNRGRQHQISSRDPARFPGRWGNLALPDRILKDNQDADLKVDRKSHLAGRQVIKESGAPQASILESVYATRTVCLSWEAALKAARVSCFGPRGTYWNDPVFITSY